MKDIKDLKDIQIFVDQFYQKVREDQFIGPIFLAQIEDWEPHLNKMYGFWNAALFGVPGFKGNPFAKHAPLGLKPNHFTRWIALFNQVIDQNFEGVMAAEVKNRAQLMATMFMKRLELLNGDTYHVIV
ncbi:MAG: group III truncated hemoglobin [Bacteroidetes bacterium]|nr:group III truncated hemoglobin [Bacteroidota bacterium]MBU1373287.1 group III truncated hemoglobin [Bacteroidota bacterium]MBU1484221.1 group III truncated hemoglobin [Bacteroidota bacterium]MBU1760529.1 group III truncated hemoglobin [Bacteroidota bacterium]MBU2268361.1 group III truncated hemoglobin [Bacteroidota bacterium]